ncbi:MAG: hypothetical protein MJY88_03775 [Bacteroidales bacterium]|nr:hypothetical protein [Bacteroidales bacterium]
MIELNDDSLSLIETDLGINVPYVSGSKVKVRKCWHFTTDGNAVDAIFMNDKDFAAGMNRIYVLAARFQIVILAFCLMDTHIHFILYGEFDECNRFMHEYIKLTSMAIAHDHGDMKKLSDVPVNYQPITDDVYLKTAICYVLRNPTVGGLSYNPYDYPWSSAALYFRKQGLWTSPVWTKYSDGLLNPGIRFQRDLLRTRRTGYENLELFEGMVVPSNYVAYELVEAVFRTCRSFLYFMGRTREDDIEQRGGTISMLSVPMQEMRQNKNEMCQRMFGVQTVRKLSSAQRLRLAKALKAKYNSSVKQIARLCGLVYDEVKTLL